MATAVDPEEILHAFLEGRLQPNMAVLEALSPSERVEVEAVLAEIRRRVEVNPLWGYRPHEKQKVYHGIRTFLGAFFGGNRSGKSYAGTADDVVQLIDRDAVPPHLLPYKVWDECKLRVVVPGLETSAAFQETVDQFRRLIPRDQLIKGDWAKSYDQRKHVITLANGNILDILSHDQNLDRFAAVTRNRVRFDEEPPGEKGKQIYKESIIRTAAIEGGQIRFTMTPLLGLSWTYGLLIDDDTEEPRWDDEARGVVASIWDNPTLSEKQIHQILSQYSTTERQAREHGRFVQLAGLVYPQFSREHHIIPDVEIPRGRDGQLLWDIYEGIDPGFDHPMGFVVVAVDQFGDERVLAAWKQRGIIVGDAAALIKKTRKILGYEPQRPAIIDPSARNKNHATGRSTQVEYMDEGIVTKPGQNSRSAGINRVQTALERKKRGEPGLMICVSAAEGGITDQIESDGGLRSEFEQHRWKRTKSGEGESQEVVVKLNDDILDPLRYVLMERPYPAKGEKDEKDENPIEAAFRRSLERLSRRRHGSNWGAPTLR